MALLLYDLFQQHNHSRYLPGRRLPRIILPTLLAIHLIFAPIGFFISHWIFSKTLSTRKETLARVTMMPQLAGKTVVLVNPPHASYASYLQIHRALAGQSLPAHVWALAPGRFEDKLQTVRLNRLDPYRLRVEVPKGIPIQLERGRKRPLRPQQVYPRKWCSSFQYTWSLLQSYGSKW